MDTQIDEIADGIFRISTFVTDAAPPFGLSFNQFLVMADEPLLFHTGFRSMFPAVSAAVARVVPPARLRWISFGHVEADECGAMNEFLALAPHAEVAFGALGCQLSLNDFADRPPHPLVAGEALDLGGRRVVQVPTPHAPHNWEAQVLYEEATATLLCGDLFSQAGAWGALSRSDLVDAALDTEDAFASAPPGPIVPATLRQLAADFPTRTLAVMHGSSFEGDGIAALLDLADGWEQRFGCPTSPTNTNQHKEIIR